MAIPPTPLLCLEDRIRRTGAPGHAELIAVTRLRSPFIRGHGIAATAEARPRWLQTAHRHLRRRLLRDSFVLAAIDLIDVETVDIWELLIRVPIPYENEVAFADDVRTQQPCRDAAVIRTHLRLRQSS